MSIAKDNLEPGDIVRAYHDLGVVMRNDDIFGLLVAMPGMDELIAPQRDELTYLGNLKEIITNLGLR